MSDSFSPIPSNTGHEAEGSNVRRIFIWLCGFMGLASVAFIIVLGFHFAFMHWSPFTQKFRPLSPLAQLRRVPPEPRLQSNPTIDMAQFRKLEIALTDSYGWVDAPAGVVRLPIERAIALVANEGLPARKGTQP
jgi:hypothetical protein